MKYYTTNGSCFSTQSSVFFTNEERFSTTVCDCLRFLNLAGTNDDNYTQ